MALDNALEVIRIQDALGLLHERTVQGWFLGTEVAVRAWNVFYGLMHDLVGVLALVLLWYRSRSRYRHWRNVAGWMLGLGLLGFWAYPITPPRLMPETYGFVDTGVEVGGIGPIRGATEEAGGNRFAAMPSLHVGRAVWAVLALWPLARRRWSRGLLTAYPPAMFLATVVTANHWILDAAGGLATLGVALGLEAGRRRVAARRGRSGLSPAKRPRPRPPS